MDTTCKTTMMDVLAGRKTGGYVEGDIRRERERGEANGRIEERERERGEVNGRLTLKLMES